MLYIAAQSLCGKIGLDELGEEQNYRSLISDISIAEIRVKTNLFFVFTIDFSKYWRDFTQCGVTTDGIKDGREEVITIFGSNFQC